jgi:hypothetical protein
MINQVTPAETADPALIVAALTVSEVMGLTVYLQPGTVMRNPQTSSLFMKAPSVVKLAAGNGHVQS